jgi:hypothetical protein
VNAGDSQHPEHEPVFVIGCPRSGTTLLQVLIDLNTDYAIPPESFVFERYAPLLATPRVLPPDQVERLGALLARDNRLQLWGLPPEFLPRFDGRGPTSSREIVTEFFAAYARFRGKGRWGEKTPQHAWHVPEILAAFPRAKIVHILRDPRDVVASYVESIFGPETALLAAKRWREYATTIDRETAGLPDGQFRMIRYEDLVTDPEQTVASLLEILVASSEGVQLSLADSPLGTHYETISNAHTAVTRKIDPSSIGKWRSGLSTRALREVEFLTRDLMERYGYVPEADLTGFTANPDRSTERLRHLSRKVVKRLVTPAAYTHTWIEFGDRASERRFGAWSKRYFAGP